MIVSVVCLFCMKMCNSDIIIVILHILVPYTINLQKPLIIYIHSQYSIVTVVVGIVIVCYNN